MKRCACLTFLILAMALSASTARAGGTLVFQGHATVNKDMICLFDLASPSSKLEPGIKNRLAKYYLLRAPGLGRVVRISASKIQTALKLARLPKDITTLIPKRIIVTRASQQLGTEEMTEMFRQAVINRLGDRAASADVHDIQVSKQLTLPAGELETKLEFMGSRMNGQILAYLVAKVDGEVCARVRIKGYVDQFSPVVVASHGLRRGQIIREKDLEVMELNLAGIKGHAASDPTDLVGLKVRGPVGYKEPVLLGQVERTPLIRRGDIVTMVVRFPGLFVRVKGKAEQTGFKDGRIRLINMATKKKVFGRVVDSSTVQVDI